MTCPDQIQAAETHLAYLRHKREVEILTWVRSLPCPSTRPRLETWSRNMSGSFYLEAELPLTPRALCGALWRRAGSWIRSWSRAKRSGSKKVLDMPGSEE